MSAAAIFVSHGAPTVALEEDDYTRALEVFGASSPPPAAFLVVSAHWEARGPLRATAAPRPPVIHDFFGFPEPLHRLRYPAPGSPALAREVCARLEGAGLGCALDADRGWDHGVWVPLRRLRPQADVPVVALSLPVPRAPEELLRAGRALAPLREQGVALLGSGGIVHNLARLRFEDKEARPESWAASFDAWVGDRVAALDEEALLAYRGAPHAESAVPTTEHFDPLFFVLGWRLPSDRVLSIHEGFHYGSLSMRTFALLGGAPRAAPRNL